jgi:hypothetical protein
MVENTKDPMLFSELRLVAIQLEKEEEKYTLFKLYFMDKENNERTFRCFDKLGGNSVQPTELAVGAYYRIGYTEYHGVGQNGKEYTSKTAKSLTKIDLSKPAVAIAPAVQAVVDAPMPPAKKSFNFAPAVTKQGQFSATVVSAMKNFIDDIVAQGAEFKAAIPDIDSFIGFCTAPESEHDCNKYYNQHFNEYNESEWRIIFGRIYDEINQKIK